MPVTGDRPDLRMTGLRPMLYTPDVEGTVEFYVRILGFTCGDRLQDWSWAAVHRDDIEIMVARPNAHTPFNGAVFSGSIYINVTDVDALWASVRDRVKVCYAPEEFDWGMREFGIWDLNGYLLQFGQDLRT